MSFGSINTEIYYLELNLEFEIPYFYIVFMLSKINFSLEISS